VGAGVADLNLVRLSSVIPPHTEVVVVDRYPFGHRHRGGDRVYAIWAERRTSVAGEQVWAGIGWSRDPNTGVGLLVEHDDVSEHRVRSNITASLADMQAIRGLDLGPVETCLMGAMCTGAPTCVLVLCVSDIESGTTATVG
jgi:arginine decarboxylase